MSLEIDSLPLFPLSSHLLPGGRLQLRIFEPRYVRLVKEACHNERGFGLCMLKKRSGNSVYNMLPIGTRVNVVDFTQLEDGMLGITVAGVERFRLGKVWRESDGLQRGEVTPLPNWPTSPLPKESRHLLSGLAEIYRCHEYLSELYPEPPIEDASWLCQRWLELIPLKAEDKLLLMEQSDCQSALRFLTDTLILK